jgi:hypothetical protein
MKSQRCQCRDIEGELANYLLGSGMKQQRLISASCLNASRFFMLKELMPRHREMFIDINH